MSGLHRPSRRAGTLTVATLFLAGSLGSLLTSPAAAAVSDQTHELCADSEVACSLQAPATWIAGASHRVGVTGAAGSEVEVRIVAVTRDKDGQFDEFDDVVKAFTVEIGDGGFGGRDVAIPADTAGGDYLVVLGDAEPGDPSEILGTWVHLLSATPRLHGDGFGEEKPVGQPITLTLDAALPGSVLEVQMEGASGWASINVDDNQGCDRAGNCRIVHEIPRGLTPTEHSFRVVNLATGSPIGSWKAVPDATGDPEGLEVPETPEPLGTDIDGALAADVSATPVTAERLANLQLPDVGAELAFAGPRPDHLEEWVRVGAVVVSVLATLWMLLLLAPTRRRRDA